MDEESWIVLGGFMRTRREHHPEISLVMRQDEELIWNAEVKIEGDEVLASGVGMRMSHALRDLTFNIGNLIRR